MFSAHKQRGDSVSKRQREQERRLQLGAYRCVVAPRQEAAQFISVFLKLRYNSQRYRIIGSGQDIYTPVYQCGLRAWNVNSPKSSIQYHRAEAPVEAREYVLVSSRVGAFVGGKNVFADKRMYS